MYDVTVFDVNGNGHPLAAGLGYWDAYTVAYHYAYTTPARIRGDVAIVRAETGERQFTFAAPAGSVA